MYHAVPTAAVFLVLAAVPVSATAQSLARRVDAVRDADVRMSFATRAGVCGDGQFIGEETPDGFRMYRIWDQGFSISTLQDVRPSCNAGPLRLVVEKRSGEIHALRAAVGVAWLERRDAVDLGTVSASDAASWLLDLAYRLREDDIRVAVLAAAMADSARIAERLMRMARDKSARLHLRQSAMRWLSGAAAREELTAQADGTLRDIASDEGDREATRERAVRSLPHTAENDAFLRDLFRTARNSAVQERIIRWLGDSPTLQNEEWIQEVALNRQVRVGLRERAVRVLGGELDRPDLVRALYGRLDHAALQERALRVVTENESAGTARWLREVAEDTDVPVSVRERALRLLGELGETQHLRAAYSRLAHTALKERVLRVVAEEERSDAADWLRDVAQDQAEATALRERAVRLLGEMRQSDYLRGLYASLERQSLRERVLRIVGEHAGPDAIDWIEGVARDGSESQGLRERAVRVLAERHVETPRLVRLYDDVDSRALRERLIRIFAERGDSSSVEKLETIMTEDPSSALRRSAARRLGYREGRGGGQ